MHCTSLYPYIQNESWEHQHQVPQPGFKFILQRPLCCPKVSLERLHCRIATRQCCSYFLSHHQGKLHSLREKSFPLWNLQLGLFDLHARAFLGHKLPLLSSYNLNFPFNANCQMGMVLHLRQFPNYRQEQVLVGTVWNHSQCLRYQLIKLNCPSTFPYTVEVTGTDIARGRDIYHLISGYSDSLFPLASLKYFFSSAFYSDSIDFFSASF